MSALKKEPSFEDFWDLYDKKVERKKCQKLWSRIPLAEKIHCIKHLFYYVNSTPNKRYRKNPSNYLYNECYYDEIIEEDYRHNEAFEHIINHYS